MHPKQLGWLGSDLGAWVLGDSLELASLELGAFYSQGESSHAIFQPMPLICNEFLQSGPKSVKPSQAIFRGRSSLDSLNLPPRTSNHSLGISSLGAWVFMPPYPTHVSPYATPERPCP